MTARTRSKFIDPPIADAVPLASTLSISAVTDDVKCAL